MPFEGFEFRPLQVPQLNGVVITATDNCLAIWTETHAKDRTTVPFEGFEFRPLQVPQLDGVVSTTTDNRLPVWTETHAIDYITVLL